MNGESIIDGAAQTIVSAAPTMTNVETATTAMTAATIALAAVAIAIAVVAVIGITILKRYIKKIAEDRVEKYLRSDLGVYLEGPEFRNTLRSLVEESQANYIRNRVDSAPDGGGAALGGGPREITK